MTQGKFTKEECKETEDALNDIMLLGELRGNYSFIGS